MTDREQKIIGNMNLVHYIVHKHFPQYTANQDVIQNGYIGIDSSALPHLKYLLNTRWLT